MAVFFILLPPGAHGPAQSLAIVTQKSESANGNRIMTA
jgi:hypothetical protein